jgi:uncharacterized protein involved in exopolysaccharide biosynthesis
MELQEITPEFAPLIDPKKLMGFIERQWLTILSLALACAIIAGLVSMNLPKTYTANALIVSTRVTYPVSLGSAIDTQTEEEFYSVLDRQSRLESFAQMVKDPAIAQLVLDDLGDQLDQEIDSASKLLELVKGEIVRGSDAIQISVTYSDPEIAAQIANQWAAAYVSHVNDVYAEAGSSEAYDEIKLQTTVAQETFDAAQAALEAHIRQNQEVAISRQINETQILIDNLVATRDQALASALNKQTQVPLFVFDTQAQAPLFLLQQQVDDLKTQISQAYTDKRRVDQLRQDAENMRFQVQLGGDGAALTSALALEMLKVQAFATSGGLGELTIQTEPISITAPAMLTDLDGLVSALEDQLDILDDDISSLTTQLDSTLAVLETKNASLEEQAAASVQSVLDLDGLESLLSLNIESSSIGQKILELEQVVRDLQAESAHEQSIQEQLTRERDLARSTYVSLATKEAELSIATQTKGSQVALGSVSAPPLHDDVSGMMIVAIAGVVGLILAVLLAIVVEFWWGYKEIEPYPIIHFRTGQQK